MANINKDKLKITEKIQYKELIEMLDLPYKTTTYRRYQIEEIQRYCNLQRKGNYYTITKIYASPLDEIKQYKVYMHRNKTNGKVYIGITLQPVNERWRNGTNYYGNEYFHRSIKKYGWDGFEHLVLFDGLSKEEAEEKEVELIQKYKSTNRNFGYNIELGGNTSGKHSEDTLRKMSESQKGGLNHSAKKVICLNNLEVFNTVKEASVYANCKPQTISKNCNDKNYSAGHDSTNNCLVWMYEEDYNCTSDLEEYIEYKIKKSYKSDRNIFIRCLNDNRVFKSIADVSKFYSINQTSVSNSITETRDKRGGVISKINGDYLLLEEVSFKYFYENKDNLNCNNSSLNLTKRSPIKIYNGDDVVLYPSLNYFCDNITFLNGIKYDNSKVGYYIRTHKGIYKNVKFEYVTHREYIDWYYSNKLKELENNYER